MTLRLSFSLRLTITSFWVVFSSPCLSDCVCRVMETGSPATPEQDAAERCLSSVVALFEASSCDIEGQAERGSRALSPCLRLGSLLVLRCERGGASVRCARRSGPAKQKGRRGVSEKKRVTIEGKVPPQVSNSASCKRRRERRGEGESGATNAAKGGGQKTKDAATTDGTTTTPEKNKKKWDKTQHNTTQYNTTQHITTQHNTRDAVLGLL